MTDLPDHISEARQVVRGLFGKAAAHISMDGRAEIQAALMFANLSGLNKVQCYSVVQLAVFMLHSDPAFLRPALFIATQAYDNVRQNSGTARNIRENIFAVINGLPAAKARVAAAQWVYQCSDLSSPLRLDMLRKTGRELQSMVGRQEAIREWLQDRLPRDVSIEFKVTSADREMRLLRAFIDNRPFPPRVSSPQQRDALPVQASLG